MRTTRFAGPPPKRHKGQRGRTLAEAIPIAIRSHVELPVGLEAHIRRELGTKLRHAATLIERGTVGFEGMTGPRGGVDTICLIKLVLSGRPSVEVVQSGKDPGTAFSLALPAIVGALDRVREAVAPELAHRGKPGHGKARAASRSLTPSARAARAAAQRR